MLFSPAHSAFAAMEESLMVVISYEKRLSRFSRVSLESPLQGQWGTAMVWGYLLHPPRYESHKSPTGVLRCRSALHGSAA